MVFWEQAVDVMKIMITVIGAGFGVFLLCQKPTLRSEFDNKKEDTSALRKTNINENVMEVGASGSDKVTPDEIVTIIRI